MGNWVGDSCTNNQGIKKFWKERESPIFNEIDARLFFCVCDVQEEFIVVHADLMIFFFFKNQQYIDLKINIYGWKFFHEGKLNGGVIYWRHIKITILHQTFSVFLLNKTQRCKLITVYTWLNKSLVIWKLELELLALDECCEWC